MLNETRDRENLLRIVEHCQRITDACDRFGSSYEAFANDEDYQDVICMNIFQIGEIVNQLSDEVKEKHGDIPWHQMYGIRNILAHAYIIVDRKIIWDTVVNDIPRLRKAIEDIGY